MALDKLTQVTASGITSTSSLSSLTLSGAITGGDATFDSVDVLGVLTYDDVTNIDALGIVTARSGIHVTGGNVGIGTDNPNAPLHVEKNGTSQILARFESNMGTNNNRSISLNSPTSDSGSEPFIFNTGNAYQFQTDDQVGLHINYDRKIGIGTDNPIKNLEVAGNTNTTIRINNYDDSEATLYFHNSGSNDRKIVTANADMIFYGSSGAADEHVRITAAGEVIIGTTSPYSFNGVGLKNNLIVAGSTSDTDITDNSSAAITVSNTDGTADNTAGLHFAREDTDGNPHYTGASIVTQFKEAQVTGQYPKADLAFLTSTAANNAPSEKMRIYASGAVTTPSNPLLKINSTSTYGAFQSLHISPNASIAQATAQINRGDTNFTTSGGNAYTFVCPVTGIYALHAHITLGDVSQSPTNDPGDRIIWSMAYTLGGGNLPLSNYVEVIDTNVFDYQNASYFDTWYFTAGTRIGMGINTSSGGSIAGHGFYWGAYLLQ